MKTTIKMKRELGDLQSKIDMLQRKLSDNTTRISEYYSKIGVKVEEAPTIGQVQKNTEEELMSSVNSSRPAR